MPWKVTSEPKARRAFVAAVIADQFTFAALCREFGICRQCGYKWWRRYHRCGIGGLRNRSHRSHQADRLQVRWQQRVLQLRRQHPGWGAPKLRAFLQRGAGRRALPAISTLSRWLRQAGLLRRHSRRARPGPRVPAPRIAPAEAPNDIWTIDFKGAFRVGDGRRVMPLTVRDAASAYVLAVRYVAKPDERHVRAVLQQLFRRHGLPRVLQVDNGTPFRGTGPLGLSRLSVWWLRLGLQIRYSRPASPQDNPAHEQMHGVLKRETTRPPASTVAAQQRRFDRWRRVYNEVRPHQAPQQRCPHECYRPSPRQFPSRLPAWSYAPGVATIRPGANGRAWWGGRQRMIGRAFAGERLGLYPHGRARVEVRLGKLVIGTLHHADRAGMRPARWQRRLSPISEQKV